MKNKILYFESKKIDILVWVSIILCRFEAKYNLLISLEICITVSLGMFTLTKH
jgi:hypothetical protein